MAAFDTTKQIMVTLAGVMMECGNNVTIANVSGQTFTIATKLRKVLSGNGVMLKDGGVATASAGVTSGGQVTFTRRGPISKASGTGNAAPDTIDYRLYGY
jgi:hypothetical protein